MNYFGHIKIFHILKIVIIGILIFLVYSCAADEKKSVANDGADISSSQQENKEDTSTDSVMSLESEYYVPSDYDILNAPPQSVIEYLKQNNVNNIESILDELDIDVKQEIGQYLQEEHISTKQKIFSNVP